MVPETVILVSDKSHYSNPKISQISVSKKRRPKEQKRDKNVFATVLKELVTHTNRVLKCRLLPEPKQSNKINLKTRERERAGPRGSRPAPSFWLFLPVVSRAPRSTSVSLSGLQEEKAPLATRLLWVTN